MICQWCGVLKPIENRELKLCGSCNKARRSTGSSELPDTPPTIPSKRQVAREYKKKMRGRHRNRLP